MKIRSIAAVFSLIAICFSVLLIPNEKKQGFVVGNEVFSLGGKLEYIESYEGDKKEIRYIGNAIHRTWRGGMYFDGWYNKIFDRIIWLNVWGGGLTKELIYLEKMFPIDSVTIQSKYLGITGIGGEVPGIDIREGCDEGLRTDGGLVVWLNGTEDYIFSDEQMTAIQNARVYAEGYNTLLRKIRCSANNSEELIR